MRRAKQLELPISASRGRWSDRIRARLYHDSRFGPAEKAVLGALGEFARHDKKTRRTVAFPRLATLASMVGASLSRVSRILSSAEDRGVIARTGTRARGRYEFRDQWLAWFTPSAAEAAAEEAAIKAESLRPGKLDEAESLRPGKLEFAPGQTEFAPGQTEFAPGQTRTYNHRSEPVSEPRAPVPRDVCSACGHHWPGEWRKRTCPECGHRETVAMAAKKEDSCRRAQEEREAEAARRAAYGPQQHAARGVKQLSSRQALPDESPEMQASLRQIADDLAAAGATRERLAQLDRRLLTAARAAHPAAAEDAAQDAQEEMAEYVNRLSPDEWRRKVRSLSDKHLRRRLNLPILRFDDR